MNYLILRLSLLTGLAVPAWLWASMSDAGAASREPTEVLRTVGRLPARDRQVLESAMALAAEQLRKQAACRLLFAALEADGLECLASTFYTAPISNAEIRSCERRNASALTSVGGRRAVLCPASFGRLRRRQAAVVLLHEALHHAGLSEFPEPGAPRSAEINRMVKVSCGL